MSEKPELSGGCLHIPVRRAISRGKEFLDEGAGLARTLIPRAGPTLYLHHKLSHSLAVVPAALCQRLQSTCR